MTPKLTKDIDTGFKCPECGSYVRRYTRSMNANMAMALLLLYKFNMMGWVKMEDFLIKAGKSRCGDFSYLVLYGLLEKKIGNRDDGSKKNGLYKITGRGLAFCSGSLTVPEKFMMLHGKLEGFKGKEITIKEALGKRFDYNELMQGFSPRTEKEKTELKLFQ